MDINPENFDFLPLPFSDSGFGDIGDFDRTLGENNVTTTAFLNRLRDSCAEHTTDWGFVNLSKRSLFSFSIIEDEKVYHYRGMTDNIGVLPSHFCNQSSSYLPAPEIPILNYIRMVIELKTHAAYANGNSNNQQIIAELLLALSFSPHSTVFGVLTSGRAWMFLWLVKDDSELVLRRCEVQGWTNGVRHLLAMLNSDDKNSARLLPQLQHLQSSTTVSYEEEGLLESEVGGGGGGGGGDQPAVDRLHRTRFDVPGGAGAAKDAGPPWHGMMMMMVVVVMMMMMMSWMQWRIGSMPTEKTVIWSYSPGQPAFAGAFAATAQS